MKRLNLALFALAIFCAGATAQLTAPNIMGTEVFIVPNPSATFNIDNVVVQDMGGTMFTINFTLPASTGNGTFGPIYNYGAYNMEPLWLQNTATGITAGHMHVVTSGGNPGDYENSHAQGTDHQGVRVSRVDGAMFQLVSVDYRNNAASMYVGTTYASGWASIAASWINIDATYAYTQNATAWTTFNFTVIPPDIKSIKLDPMTNFFSFNTSNGTFNVGASVQSYITINDLEITDPAIDPIIGATVTLFGSYVGSDLSTLSGIFMSNVSTSIIVAPGADQLTTTQTFVQSLGAGDINAFGGPIGATPIKRRAIGQTGPAVVNRLGSGSHVLDILATALNSELMTLNCNLDSSGPRLYSLEKSYVLPSVPAEVRFRTNGFGSAQIGMIGLTPGSQIYNVFAMSPVSTLGGGPFFGIDFGPEQILQLSLPLGVNPFHVSANADGVYFYGVPTGTLPSGLVADLATIAITPQGLATQIGSPIRVTF